MEDELGGQGLAVAPRLRKLAPQQLAVLLVPVVGFQLVLQRFDVGVKGLLEQRSANCDRIGGSRALRGHDRQKVPGFRSGVSDCRLLLMNVVGRLDWF